MKKIKLSDYTRGWLIGDFEPTLYKNKDLEVAVQQYNAGDKEPQHHHKVGTEISIMISGSAYFNKNVLHEGEGIVIYPKEDNVFEAITDCKVLVIKYPSKTDDKYLGVASD